ncbi:MAG: ribonuclease P protein component [Candidatus Eisenbacteria bacterium]|nr:ribonuclease P protein component [Candidatus Eisenbacteria bacterium]
MYKTGTAVRGSLIVLILRGTELDAVRCAVVASRRVGNAVKRNRCKRLLREGCRALRAGEGVRGVDLLLIARAACAGAHVNEVRAEAADLYKKAAAAMVNGRQQTERAEE